MVLCYIAELWFPTLTFLPDTSSLLFSTMKDLLNQRVYLHSNQTVLSCVSKQWKCWDPFWENRHAHMTTRLYFHIGLVVFHLCLARLQVGVGKVPALQCLSLPAPVFMYKQQDSACELLLRVSIFAHFSIFPVSFLSKCNIFHITRHAKCCRLPSSCFINI